MSSGYRISEIVVRGGVLIGYSLLKPRGGEEACFMLSRHGSAPIAKRFAQNACSKLNGDDDWNGGNDA